MDIGILASKFYDYSSYTKGFTKPTILRYKGAINHYRRIANVTQINQVTEQNVRDFLLYGRTERENIYQHKFMDDQNSTQNPIPEEPSIPPSHQEPTESFGDTHNLRLAPLNTAH